MPKLRLGVALLLASPVAEEVDGLRRALGDASLGRVPPHVTLVPPVNVREDQLARALGVLRSAAAATPDRLTLTLGPPTSFLPDNAVLYLSVAGDLDALVALRRRVWEEPLTRPLSWPFVPHVTLADDASTERIEAAIAALGGYQREVAFDRVVLLVERRPGPHWVPLADAAFGPPAIVARAGPLAVEMVRSRYVDPEARALIVAEGTDDAEEPGPCMVVTARREGEVVGVGRVWLSPDGCRRTVLVGRAHRHQGIGRHLDAALEMAVIDAGWRCHYPRGEIGKQ